MQTLEQYVACVWPAIAETVGLSTRASYDRALRLRVLPTLGSLPIDKVGVAEVEKAYYSWSGAPSTRQDALAILSRVMKRAVRDGHAMANPVPGIEKPRRSVVVPMPRALTPDEVDDLFVSVPDWYHAFIGLMVYAGLRFGEASGLTWEDVDISRGVIKVSRQLDRTGNLAPTKSGRPRVVPIRAELEELLLAHARLTGRADGLVCTTENGAGIHASNLARHLRWRTVRDGIRPGLRFHDLRHHCASTFLAEGHPMNAVQAWLGHANVSVTSRYVVSGEREAINALTRLNPARVKRTVGTAK